MKRLYIPVLGAVTALVAATAPAAAAPAASPVEILQAGADLGVADGYPGVIGLVRSGDDTQYAHAGNSDRFAGVPADPGDRFRIGSNTKAFVATVLLQLAGEGSLSLDDPVAKWLPGAVDAGGFDGTKITIRELLNHTSGLPDYLKDVRVNGPYVANLNPSRPWPPQSLVDIALTGTATGEPGERYSYSNTNYVLAGMVIKAVTGNDAATEVQRRIIEPLGLTNTTFPTTDPTMPGKHMNGYFWVGQPADPRRHPRPACRSPAPRAPWCPQWTIWRRSSGHC